MKIINRIKMFLIYWASFEVFVENTRTYPDPIDFLSPKRLNPYYWKIKRGDLEE